MTHKDATGLLGKHGQRSGQRRDGRHQAELNPDFPVKSSARSRLFLAICGARDRDGARLWLLYLNPQLVIGLHWNIRDMKGRHISLLAGESSESQRT